MPDSTSPAAKSHDEGGRSRAARSAVPAAELGIGQIARQWFESGYVYSAQPANVAYLTVQSVVDCSELLSRKLVDIEIIEGGNVVEVLRLPVFDEDGQRLPSDPGAFSLAAVWHLNLPDALAPYAAARCGLR